MGEKVEEQAPKILTQLKDRKITEGKDCKLEVKYSGEPAPTVDWKKNGKEVNIGRRFEVVGKEGVTMLRILSVRKSDSGEYTVILTNKHGSETSTAHLSITSEGIWFLHMFTNLIQVNHTFNYLSRIFILDMLSRYSALTLVVFDHVRL